ncbi:class I SAM-dependent methyltransferase [Luminiphilus sp.]|nr:class I SAM-dependent methyltransferase [Luminiphilus sp.]
MNFDELKERYIGSVATRYDQDRITQPKWIRETEAILLLLQNVECEDLSILDLPCGTGRIIDLLSAEKIKFRAYKGGDISEDMLEVSRSKLNPKMAGKVTVTQANALSYRHGENEITPSLIFCLRFVNWLKKNDLITLLENLKKSGATRICITNRSIKPASNIVSKIIYQLTARLSYSTWKREQKLHDNAFFLKVLGTDWSLDGETNLETRLDATALSLLIFKKK